MESWNFIINSALLGTDKSVLKKEVLEPGIAGYVDVIEQPGTDKEDAFMQSAALVYNYRQCGFLPLRKESASLPLADTEVKPYASAPAHGVLYAVMETGSISLLQYWLTQCHRTGAIVQPGAVPALMDAAARNKELQAVVASCCGNRGLWLAQLNPLWTTLEPASEAERWQTGTLEQRTEVLAQIRSADPARGRELLQQVWSQENAAVKTELVRQLSINAGAEDLPWLEALLTEKSSKVRDVVLGVLKGIPASAIVQQYWQALQQSISLKTSKGLLGLGSKTQLAVQLVVPDTAIYKTGIQQLSSTANTNDEHFVLSQLVASVPPHFWEAHFGMEPHGIIELFLKDSKHQAFVPAFGQAAFRFGNREWMRALVALDRDHLYADAFILLPQREAEAYAVQFFSSHEGEISTLAPFLALQQEWGMSFAKVFLRLAARNPYQYSKIFYNQVIHLLPLPLAGELEKCTPKEEHLRTMWSSLSDYIHKLLSLKLQTLKAFNE